MSRNPIWDHVDRNAKLVDVRPGMFVGLTFGAGAHLCRVEFVTPRQVFIRRFLHAGTGYAVWKTKLARIRFDDDRYIGVVSTEIFNFSRFKAPDNDEILGRIDKHIACLENAHVRYLKDLETAPEEVIRSAGSYQLVDRPADRLREWIKKNRGWYKRMVEERQRLLSFINMQQAAA